MGLFNKKDQKLDQDELKKIVREELKEIAKIEFKLIQDAIDKKSEEWEKSLQDAVAEKKGLDENNKDLENSVETDEKSKTENVNPYEYLTE